MGENTFVFGEEYTLVQSKVSEIVQEQKAGLDSWAVENLYSWRDIQEKLLTLGMFSKQRVFLLDYEVIMGEKPDLIQLSQLLQSHSNKLIIYSYSKPDKRTQVFKTISNQCKALDVQPLKGADLKAWLLNHAHSLGAKMDHKAVEMLIYYAGTNMQTLINEVEKLNNYCEIIDADSIQKLAVRDVQASIFDLVDSVAEGDSSKALVLADDLLRRGNGIPYILHMLARQYRLLFRLLFYKQRGYSIQEIQKTMPMHSYAFQKLQKQGANFSLKQCARSLYEIGNADYSFKTGMMSGLPLIQMLTVKLAKK